MSKPEDGRDTGPSASNGATPLLGAGVPETPPPSTPGAEVRRTGARSFVDMVRESVERPRGAAAPTKAVAPDPRTQADIAAERRRDEAELMRLERMLRSLQERVSRLEDTRIEPADAEVGDTVLAPSLVEREFTPAHEFAAEERHPMPRAAERREGGPRRLWPAERGPARRRERQEG